MTCTKKPILQYSTVALYKSPCSGPWGLLAGFSGRCGQALLFLSLPAFQKFPLLLLLLLYFSNHLFELDAAGVQRIPKALSRLGQQFVPPYFLLSLLLFYLPFLLFPVCDHLGHFGHVCSNSLLTVWKSEKLRKNKWLWSSTFSKLI